MLQITKYIHTICHR